MDDKKTAENDEKRNEQQENEELNAYIWKHLAGSRGRDGILLQNLIFYPHLLDPGARVRIVTSFEFMKQSGELGSSSKFHVHKVLQMGSGYGRGKRFENGFSRFQFGVSKSF